MVWYVNHSNSEIILAVGRIKKSSKMNLLLLTISYYDYVLKKIWYWNFTIVLFQWKKIHILGVVYFFPNKLNIMTCSLVLIDFVTTNIWIFDHPTLLFLRLHHWNWGELHIKGTARGTSRHHTRHFPLLDKLSPVLYTTLHLLLLLLLVLVQQDNFYQQLLPLPPFLLSTTYYVCTTTIFGLTFSLFCWDTF